MSLLKLPLIASALVLHDRAFTAPNPSPPTERNIRGLIEKTIWRNLTFVSTMQKSFVWFAGLAEAAVIVAARNPSWRLSKPILNNLMFGGDTDKIIANPPFLVGSLLVISGSLLRLQCFRQLGKLFTWEMSIQKDHQLVTSGPYSVVRHPSYAGILIVLVGFLTWQGGRGSWIRESGVLQTWAGKGLAAYSIVWFTSYGVGVVSRTKSEDEMLKKEFGQQWEAWKKVTSMLIPWVY